MMAEFYVHLLPTLVHDQQLTDRTCVVLDVLRATTSMVEAIHSGAKGIIPCLEIADALSIRESLGAECFCGGERFGHPVAGFDCGNSPSEYSPARVKGKWVALTTTNGTRAIGSCRDASEVLIGSFLNAGAVVRALQEKKMVHIVCAGTDGEVTLEDVLLAGYFANEFLPESGWRWNDSARLALQAWQAVAGQSTKAKGATKSLSQKLADAMRQSLGGRNLVALGYDTDIQDAAQLNKYDILPKLDRTTGRIIAHPQPIQSAR